MEERPQVKECRWPLDTGKGKGMHFLLELAEGMRALLPLDSVQ